MKNIIALIPARGGSKRLPRKNIRKLCGKPLIGWTIEQAQKCKYFGRVVVSTDDEEIAKISKSYGAEVPFLRPKKLAQDNSPSIDAVIHAIDWFGDKGEYFEDIALLEPTSPLRKKNDLNKAIEHFINHKADSLVSVGEVHLEDPSIMKKIESNIVKPFFETLNNKVPAYFPYGVIYLSKVDALREYGTFYQRDTIPYLIERWQNYEIDDIYDFYCVEAIMKSRIRNLRKNVI